MPNELLWDFLNLKQSYLINLYRIEQSENELFSEISFMEQYG